MFDVEVLVELVGVCVVEFGVCGGCVVGEVVVVFGDVVDVGGFY